MLAGMGRCLDIAGLFDSYNTSRTGEEADARAIAADFRAVGKDLKEAIETVTAERE